MTQWWLKASLPSNSTKSTESKGTGAGRDNCSSLNQDFSGIRAQPSKQHFRAEKYVYGEHYCYFSYCCWPGSLACPQLHFLQVKQEARGDPIRWGCAAEEPKTAARSGAWLLREHCTCLQKTWACGSSETAWSVTGFTSGWREFVCYGKNILCSSANFARAFSGEESHTVQSSRTKGYLGYLELEGSFGQYY